MSEVTQLTQQVSALLEERLGVVVDSSAQDLFDSGALDSLSFVNLLVELESEFGIDIALEELDFEQLSTIDGIAGYLTGFSRASIARTG